MAHPYGKNTFPSEDLVDGEESEVARLREKLAVQEAQLVAADALYEGNVDLAAKVLAQVPGAIEVRRTHMLSRVPAEEVTRVLGRGWQARFSPVRHYVSIGFEPGRTNFHEDLAGPSLSQPDPNTRRPLHRGQTSLWRSGSSGLPKDWQWLVLGWSLEFRHTAGWDFSRVDGDVIFTYNSRYIATRPLTDALVPREVDLFVHVRENLQFEVRCDCRVAPLCVDRIRQQPGPRLYAFFDVLEERTVY